MLERIAVLSVHTSPLATLGGNKTGGMNVYINEMARELGCRGIGVDIYTRRVSPDQPEVDVSLGPNVRVIHVLAGPPAPLDPMEIYPHLQQFAAGVIRYTTKQGGLRYDLVYSHYWLSGWVANKLKEVWGTPFVQMFHTLGHMKNRIANEAPPMPDVRVRLETQIVGWADRIIAATEAERSQLLWLYRADRRKIAIVPPGVNAERFFPSSQAEAKAQLGIAEDQNLLLFVGRIEPLKAVDTILEAVLSLRHHNPEVLEKTRFAIIGGTPDNPELTRLVKMAHALNLSDVVEFLGAKDQHLLPLYYTASTAVIMPSDYESFGMVALEAMASGTPVIASEVGGLAFLVRDNETGFLVPVREPVKLASRIYALLTDEEMQKRLGHNAAEMARAYAWPSIVDRLLALFTEVVYRLPGKRRQSL
jgi:D-inositol-3-phosphate glycosyltransferase